MHFKFQKTLHIAVQLSCDNNYPVFPSRIVSHFFFESAFVHTITPFSTDTAYISVQFTSSVFCTDSFRLYDVVGRSHICRCVDFLTVKKLFIFY